MKQRVSIQFNGMTYSIFKEEWDKICPQNQQTLSEFDLSNKRLNLSESTRANNLSFIIGLSKKIQKPYKEITRQDLNGYFDVLNLSDKTRSQYILLTRKFFKWLYGKKNPDCIKDIQPIEVKKTKLKFSDMVSEEEICKLIDSYPDPQHKALVAVLYDSACRVGELIGLNREDVVCNNGQWIISVDGKTGVRNIPLRLSSGFLERWFNEYHPFKDQRTAPLFLSMSNKQKYKALQERRLGVPAVWSILKQGEQASGIKKEIHPHLLRHSRLTWLADHGMPENMMRIYAGWTNGSNMPAVYLHTNPQDIALKIDQIQGSASPEQSKPEPSKLLPRECPRCHTKNDASAPYCSQCWLPLNIKVSMMETLVIDLLRSELYKDEAEIARQEGRFLDVEYLAEKLQDSVRESNKSGRKQVTAQLIAHK